MKLKNTIASLCIGLYVASPLALAAPPDHAGPQGGHDAGKPGQQQAYQHAPGNAGQGNAHNTNQGRAQVRSNNNAAHRQGPQQDLNHDRQVIHNLRNQIGRGGQLPPGLVIAKGKPLPHGYGKPIPANIARQLPYYQGYEWRRLGTDMVLVAIGTGIVYAVLDHVLD